MESPTSAAFGQLLERLKGNAVQIDFARKFGITRQQYGMIKSGKRRPDERLRDALVEHFPEHQAEIYELYAQVEAERVADRTRRATMRSAIDRRLQLMLAGLIQVGRVREAKASVERSLAAEPAAATRVWLLEQLADLEPTVGNPDGGDAALREAIEVAHGADLHDEEIRLRLTLARRFASRMEFAAAHVVLDEGLKHHPKAGALWRRKGMVHWYQHDYGEAYACLDTARVNGIPLSRVVHSRGQILAEWGNYAAAIEDLTQAIEEATSPANEAYARSARAYAMANLGDVDRAMSEFDIAELTTPNNAWLHYFRALCHAKIGNKERLIEGLKRALECEVPSLNPAKRAHAIAVLKEHGIEINPAV